MNAFADDRIAAIAEPLLRGDLEGAFAAAERALEDGPKGEEEIRRLTFPFGRRPAEREAARWRAVADALNRYRGPARHRLWARFYGIALPQALGQDSWEEGRVKVLCGAARGRDLWMRWLPGTLLLRRTLWSQAAAQLAPVARALPRAITPICSLAEALIGLRRSSDALKVLEVAKPETPTEASSWWAWKGQIRLWLGRYVEASECLERAGDYDLSFCWRGAAALLRGEPDKARKILDEALLRMPHDVEARTWRSEARRLCADHAGALEDADKVLTFSSENVFALTNRALSKVALNDRDGARADFHSIRSQRTVWRRHLGGLHPAWEYPGQPGEVALREALEQALMSAKGNRRTDYSLLLTIAAAGGSAR